MTDQPVVIVESRWKAGLLALGGVVFVAAGVWLLHDPTASRDMAVACIVFFGACGLIGVAQVFRPATLTLDPTGFRLRQLWSNRLTPWGQVSNFRIWSPRPPLRFVGYDVAPDSPGLGLGGNFRTLPGNWSKSPPELLALLTECKAKWG